MCGLGSELGSLERYPHRPNTIYRLREKGTHLRHMPRLVPSSQAQLYGLMKCKSSGSAISLMTAQGVCP